MLSRSAATMAASSQRASAMRRMRRRPKADHLYCGTNGCTTFLTLDSERQIAYCGICGFERRLS